MAQPPRSAPDSARAAIPVFRGRVAPVLDTCTRLLVLEAGSRELPVRCTCLTDRVEKLLDLGIQVVICGAVSTQLAAMLADSKISLICGIAGEVGEVTKAYRQGQLHLACYHLPGF
jgi:hypothetical protein